MRRYLPLSILATAAVIVLPAVLVAAAIPRGGVLLTLCSAAAAVALSLLLATVGAAAWKRAPRSRDLVFAELMLWGWARRCWTERRLSQARELYESARRAGPLVNIELLLGLSRLLEARDVYVHGHGQRVARHAVRIGRALGLSEREVARLRTAAEVHDVGKLHTPREVLNNPGRLSEQEYATIKRHAACGAEMLSVVGDPEIAAMVRHHHERIDGKGYPDGLAATAIPLGARIIAVADTFDAITSDRAYRRAGSQRHALKILAAEAGAQLDADAVAAFRQHYAGRRPVAWYAVGTAAAQRLLILLQAASGNLGAGFATVGGLLPALGAAGVLAVSAGSFRAAHSISPLGGVADDTAALLQPSQGAPAGSGGLGSGGAGTGGSLGGVGHRGPSGQPIARIGPRSLGGAPATTLGGATGGAGGAGAPGSPGGGSGIPDPAGGAGSAGGGGVTTSPGSSGSPLEAVHAPATPPLPIVPVGRAGGPGTPTTTPTVSTPAASTPAITTPSVSTPALTAPGVSAGPVKAPSVTVPSITVPSVTVPPVTLPR